MGSRFPCRFFIQFPNKHIIFGNVIGSVNWRHRRVTKEILECGKGTAFGVFVDFFRDPDQFGDHLFRTTTATEQIGHQSVCEFFIIPAQKEDNRIEDAPFSGVRPFAEQSAEYKGHTLLAKIGKQYGRRVVFIVAKQHLQQNGLVP